MLRARSVGILQQQSNKNASNLLLRSVVLSSRNTTTTAKSAAAASSSSSAVLFSSFRNCSTTSSGEEDITAGIKGSLHHQSQQHQHGHNSGRRTFQPFTEKDEQDLVNVMSSKPRHVLRHVRQSIWRGRKRELHFRSTVTHLMIVLQDFLRKQQIEPANAAIILEGTMEECVRLSQHDMAHLLFRAFLRFRKYGCQISLDALRLLFESYRGTDNSDMMLQLAQEMSGEPELRAFCIAAYLYAGRLDEAEQLKASIPASEIEAQDFVAMVHGYHKLQLPEKIIELVRGLVTLTTNSNSASSETSSSIQHTAEELGEVIAAALKAFYESNSDSFFNECFDIGRRLEVAFPASAFATVLRMRLRKAETMADVTQVENDLRAIGYVPDLTGNSVLVAAYARMIHFGDKGSEEVMLSKVDTLLSSIETRLKQQDPDVDVSSAHLRAVIRGYGAAGRPELMKKAWESMQYKGLSNDTRVYNELIKWFCLMGNVKDVLKTKSEMVRDEVQPDAVTFTWIMRALGKFYPRQAERFYQELRSLRIRPDSALYTTLIGLFGDLGNYERVEELRNEISSRETAGTLAVYPHTYAVLLRIYNYDLDKIEELWKECVAKGISEHDHVVTTLLHAYANHPSNFSGNNTIDVTSKSTSTGNKNEENSSNSETTKTGIQRLEKFLSTLPAWSTSVYNVLLNLHGKTGEIEKVNELLDKMKREGTQLNDVTFGTLVNVFGKAKQTDKVAEVMEMIKQQEGQVTANFYSILASTYSKLGDTDGIDEAWEDMMASRLFPDTETYNSFLTLYSKHHNVRRMQVVLDSMMKHVPPNPITSTTVVDMLGKAGRLAEMEELVADMRKLPETAPTTVTFHQLLNAYAKAGDIVKMEKTREDLLAAGFQESAVTFNILADGYGRSRRFEHVAELIQRRKEANIPMEELGYCVLIANYGRARLSAEVLKFSRELKAILAAPESEMSQTEKQQVVTRKVCWALIDACCRCNETTTMTEWIQQLGELTNTDRNQLISYYARCGMLDQVESAVKEIEDSGEDVSFTALNAISKSFAKQGRFDKCVEVLHRMRDREMVPDAATALTLSQMFIRAGLHEQAQQIIQWRRYYAKSGQMNNEMEGSDDVIV